MAQAAAAVMAATEGRALTSWAGPDCDETGQGASVDAAYACAALRVAAGDVEGAAHLAQAALAEALPGSAGWVLPIEPLLGVHRHARTWAPVLATLSARAF
jgi:hypothetical protein